MFLLSSLSRPLFVLLLQQQAQYRTQDAVEVPVVKCLTALDMSIASTSVDFKDVQGFSQRRSERVIHTG